MMIPKFILIEGKDMPYLLSANGVIEAVIIGIAIIITMRVVYKIKTSLMYKELFVTAPFKAGLFACIVPTLVFFIFTFVSGQIYGIITHHRSLLILSVSILSIFIGLLNFFNYLIDITFVYDRKHIKLRSFIKLLMWILLTLWVTDIDNMMAVNLSEIFVTFASSKVSLWAVISESFFILCSLGVILWVIAIFDNIIIEKITGLEANEKSLIKRTFKILAMLVGVYVILPSLGVNLTSLSVLGGGLGVGIGLGLQKIASNFISGFIILIDKSVKIGDRVVISNITGIITQITTRYTVMEAFDGSEIIIPNEQFITNPIINQTHTNQEIGLELGVSVGYSSDLRKVIELINEIIANHKLVNKNKSPTIAIKNLGASGIDIFIRVWPLDALNDATTIRNDLNIAFLEEFRVNNIEVPFPKLDVTMLNSPTVKV